MKESKGDHHESNRKTKAHFITLQENISILSALPSKRIWRSRQVIVGDVALLRAEFDPGFGDSEGYLLQSSLAPLEGAYIRKIACQHGPEDVEKS